MTFLHTSQSESARILKSYFYIHHTGMFRVSFMAAALSILKIYSRIYWASSSRCFNHTRIRLRLAIFIKWLKDASESLIAACRHGQREPQRQPVARRVGLYVVATVSGVIKSMMLHMLSKSRTLMPDFVKFAYF